MLKKEKFENQGTSRQTAVSSISAPTWFPYKEEDQYFRTESSTKNKKYYFNILKEEVKPVVLEEHEFENRGEFILQIILAFLAYDEFNAETGLTVSQNPHSSIFSKIWIEILVE